MSKLSPFTFEESTYFQKTLQFPSHWLVEAAHFAFDEVRDGTHDSPKAVENGIPLITSKNLKVNGIDFADVTLISQADHEEIIKRSSVKKGDVLFSMIGTVGNVAIVPEFVDFSIKNVGLFRSKPKYLLPLFSYYWLKCETYQKYLDNLKRGGNQKFVSLGILRSSPVPIAPIAEQQQIAARLDELLAQVDTLKIRLDAIPKILKRFRQSVLAAAVSGKLTEDWSDVNGNFSEWQKMQLGSLIAEGPKNGLYKASSSYGNGTRILRIDNFYAGVINAWQNLKRLTVNDSDLDDFGLKVGDIIVNRVNSMSHLGKSALVRELPEPCVFESNMMRIRLDVSRILPEYCILLLTSPDGIFQLQKNAKQAVNQASINQSDVKAIIVTIPSLDEQSEIVRRAELFAAYADQIEQRVKDAQNHVNHLTQAILAKAFRGELTADWREKNPDLISGENSAEALLTKIKAEQAATKRPKL